MKSSRHNPRKMMAALRNKNLEYAAYTEKITNLHKRSLSSLSYNVKKKNWYKKHTLEPIEIIKEVEVPFDVIREVEVKVPFEVVKEVPVEVTVEVIKEVEVEVPVPFEVIREVEVPVEVIKEVEVKVPFEVIKEVEVPVPYNVEVIKEVKVEVPVEVIKEVEVPFEVIREIEVFIPDEYVIDLQKQKEKSDTSLKLERIARRSLETRYKTSLAKAKSLACIEPEKIVSIEPTKTWLSTYIYILTMFSLTQILWMVLC